MSRSIPKNQRSDVSKRAIFLPPTIPHLSNDASQGSVEGKHIYAAAAFYQDISAANETANNCYIALFGDAAVGSTEDRPIVLVQPEWQEGLFNRPAKVISYSQSTWVRVSLHSCY